MSVSADLAHLLLLAGSQTCPERTGRKRTAKEADRRKEEEKKNDLDNASGVCARLKDVGGFVVSFLEMKQQ